ncbi:hypothetical protein ES711_11015 [Gelidibacter salicanalis]|uniref:Uncharacterized protein n=1 Tax=Gelidibacter salicanalis TaxID=291193 RepID=A0A5C7AGL2_9FLAO|nr:hypothetical protein [Gelidibacter salicanalis]TXE07946.1 hypothetical protein ES711_11015 [Gelidibacter salicanalis]
MKKTLQILFTLIFISCLENKKELIQTELKITNEFKIEILNQILSDTIDLKLMRSKEMYLSNYDGIPPPVLPMDTKRSGYSITHSEYIAQQLGVNDVEFIKKQMADNKRFDLNKLSEYGFNILDVKGYLDKEIYYSKILEKTENQKYYGFFTVSIPIFNKSLNKAYIRTMDFGGETLLLKKINDKWLIDKKIDSWID